MPYTVNLYLLKRDFTAVLRCLRFTISFLMDNLGVAPVFGERATWSILRKYFSAFDPFAKGEIQWQERKTKSDQ